MRATFRQRYARLIADGVVDNPSPAEETPLTRSGCKQSKATNLLDRLQRADDVLAFIKDVAISFDNSQDERDVRMIKVQQKVSSTFRSELGAHAFACVRSHLSTLRKEGMPLFAALANLFRSHLPSLA